MRPAAYPDPSSQDWEPHQQEILSAPCGPSVRQHKAAVYRTKPHDVDFIIACLCGFLDMYRYVSGLESRDRYMFPPLKWVGGWRVRQRPTVISLMSDDTLATGTNGYKHMAGVVLPVLRIFRRIAVSRIALSSINASEVLGSALLCSAQSRTDRDQSISHRVQAPSQRACPALDGSVPEGPRPLGLSYCYISGAVQQLPESSVGSMHGACM